MIRVVTLNPLTAINVTLLKLSYDPTREPYQDYDTVFARYGIFQLSSSLKSV